MGAHFRDKNAIWKTWRPPPLSGLFDLWYMINGKITSPLFFQKILAVVGGWAVVQHVCINASNFARSISSLSLLANPFYPPQAEPKLWQKCKENTVCVQLTNISQTNFSQTNIRQTNISQTNIRSTNISQMNFRPTNFNPSFFMAETHFTLGPMWKSINHVLF